MNMNMVIKNFITCTSVACAGISIWFAVRKYGYFKRDSGEDRNFRPKKKSKLIPVDEDKTITVLASMVGAGSEEHIQIEEDIKLDIVAPMQSDNRKNSQTIINNDIHQSPPYNADSVSSLHHAAKVVSKQLEESPADVQSSMEFPLNLTEPIPEQPSLVNGVTEEPMVPEKHLEEPAPKVEIPSSQVFDSTITSQSVTDFVNDIHEPTVVVEPFSVLETSVALSEAYIRKTQITNVEQDIREEKESNFPYETVPEKQLEEEPAPKVKIGESSLEPVQDITLLLPMTEKEETIEVAEVCSSQVFHSGIPSPVMPVDSIADLRVPTVVVEPLPDPETFVSVPEVLIPTPQISSAESDIEKEKESNFPDNSMPEKQLEEEPGLNVETEKSTLVSVQDNILPSPVVEKEERIEAGEVTSNLLLALQLAPTVATEQIPLSKISVAIPEVSIPKPHVTNVESDIREEKESNFPYEPMPKKQLEKEPATNVEKEKPTLVFVHDNTLPSPVAEKKEKIEVAEVPSSLLLFQQLVATVGVEPIPVSETYVAVPKVSIPKPHVTNVESDIREEKESNFLYDPMPKKQLEKEPATNVEKEKPTLVFVHDNTLPSPVAEKKEKIEVAEVPSSLLLFQQLVATVGVEPIPLSETYVAVPEVSIPKPPLTNVEPDVREEKQSNFLYDPMPKKQLEKEPATNVEKEKPTLVFVHDNTLQSPVAEKKEKIEVAEVPSSLLLFQQLVATVGVEPIPVSETSATVPEVSNYLDDSPLVSPQPEITQQENPSIKSVCPCNEGPLNPEGKKRDNTKLKNKYKLNVKRMYKQLADIQEENESNSIDDSPLEFPLIEITQQEKSSVKSAYTSKEGPLNPESEKRYNTGFLKIFKSNVKTVYKQLVAEHDLRVKQYCPVPETSGAVSKVLIPKPETAEREKPSEGQWRPLNFGGKKRYDTNFLEMFNSNLKRRYKQLAAEDDLKVSKLLGKVHYPVRIS